MTKRKWLLFERPYVYRPEPYTFKYSLPKDRPEPWRTHSLAERNEVFYVPVSFVCAFADMEQISNNRIQVPDKISELKSSIDREGLKRPTVMKLDIDGKLRFHDGYHRLTAILELENFPRIPVILERSSGRSKAFGRPLASEAEVILRAASAE